MALLRAVLTFMMGGALVGLLLASYFGPKWLVWDNSPASSPTAMCQCIETTRQAAERLINYQLQGGIAGAGAGAALGIGFVVWRKRRAKAKDAAAS